MSGRKDFLTTTLRELIGGKSAASVEKAFGITTAGGLVNHYPRRYLDRGNLTPFDKVEVGVPVTILATIRGVDSRRMQQKRGFILVVSVSDGVESMELTFFNQKWRERELKVGRIGLFAGTVSEFRGVRTLTHPQYSLFTDTGNGVLEEIDAITEFTGEIIPVYPSSQSLASWQIQAAIDIVLTSADQLTDPLPTELVTKHGFMTKLQSLQAIHQPKNHEEIGRATERIKYEEAFVLLALMRQRKSNAKSALAHARGGSDSALTPEFDLSLPFDLTQGQIAVGEEIAADLAQGVPMTRLLQGDVGSGKTIVSIRAMLTVIESGGQIALLAPTEVLAVQHCESLRRFLKGVTSRPIHVELLTGAMSVPNRRRILLDTQSGDVDVLIGTHALLEDNVQFFDLGLIVIDEQHRFGVEQRATMLTKGKDELRPHLLVMTATPIPRTVALTVFGDLDVSTLVESPSLRAEIQTFLVPTSGEPRLVERVWERMAEEVAAENRVFVVCPSISPSETDPKSDKSSGREPLASVEETYDALTARYPQISFEKLHGALDSNAKREAMRRFEGIAEPKVDVLIATTVIEVGVDIPAATMIIVLNAERFGISQLHQLRGRIGRGSKPGVCILVHASTQSAASTHRLEAVRDSRDGFALSQKDLEIRGEGDVLGQDQSGALSSLRLLKVIEDLDFIDKVRHEIDELFTSKLWGQVMETIDIFEIQRAEYLEKS
ncbi:ATP-dependent DNA helicase RecG [Candidatus Nanopelagicales bacterium]|nr:ATP-dependent DNA helicase RecG [Candidatus Nanopelagicales bacterium]